MKTFRGVYSREGAPDVCILVRERREAFDVEVEKDGRSTMQTWPGPTHVSLVELLLRYRDEFGLGYELKEFFE